MGYVSRMVARTKKTPNPLSCISLKCQGRRTVVGGLWLQILGLFPAALASLLFSKILWLPSLENETCRSPETSDYDFFFILIHSVFVLKCFVYLFSDFCVAVMHWVSVPPASHPAAGACLSTGCPLQDLPESRLCVVWVDILLIHPENESLKRLFLFIHRVNSNCILPVNFKACIASFATFSALVCAAFPCQGP